MKEQTEIEKLLQELQNMRSEKRAKHIENNRETWRKINQKDLESLGFESEAEMKEWIASNPYANIA